MGSCRSAVTVLAVLVAAVDATAVKSQSTQCPAAALAAIQTWQEVVIPLDDTGIASLKFVNPRRAFALAKPHPLDPWPGGEPKTLAAKAAACGQQWRAAALATRVYFLNLTTDRSIVVRVPYTRPPGTLKALRAGVTPVIDAMLNEIRKARMLLQLPDGVVLTPNARNEELRRLDDLEASLIKLPAILQAGSAGAAIAAAEEALAALNDPTQTVAEGKRQVSELNALTQPAAAPAAPAQPAAADRSESLEDLAKQVQKWIDVLKAPGEHRAAIAQGSSSASMFAKPFWDFPIRAADDDRAAGVRLAKAFETYVSGLRALAEETEAEAKGHPLTCDPPGSDGKRKCVEILQPPGGGPPLELSPKVIELAEHKLAYSVSFFDTDDVASNPNGYLLTGVLDPESPSKTTWQVVSAVGAKVDPDTTQNPPPAVVPYSPQHPYTGDDLRRFFGSARLDLTQTLGDRAKASVTIGYKSGDLGAAPLKDDGKPNNDYRATVSQYSIETYALNGVTTRFGRFDMARPSSGIAVNESGEGVQVSWRAHSLGLKIKQESIQGFAQEADDDSQTLIYQARGLPLRSFLRAGDIYLQYGEEKGVLPAASPQAGQRQSYDYQTVGGELRFGDLVSGDEHLAFSGSLAGYQSRRRPRLDCDGACRKAEGEGTVGLLTLSWSRLEMADGAAKLARSLSFFAGYGTGDRPETGTDEGYLGETAGSPGSFTPSTHLASFTSSLDKSLQGPIGAGLSNKTYFALQFIERGFKKLSPLYLIAGGLGLQRDIQSSETKVSVRRIAFNEKVFGAHDGGIEAELQWLLQAPAGVNSTLSVSRLFAAKALRPLFKEDPTKIEASVSVTLK